MPLTGRPAAVVAAALTTTGRRGPAARFAPSSSAMLPPATGMSPAAPAFEFRGGGCSPEGQARLFMSDGDVRIASATALRVSTSGAQYRAAAPSTATLAWPAGPGDGAAPRP